MSTLVTLWGPASSGSIASLPKFTVCAMEVQTLNPRCFGTYEESDDMHPPQEALWGLSSGGYFTCGLTADGHHPVCWGNIDNSTIPTSVSEGSYRSIGAGGFHVCAVRSTMDSYTEISSVDEDDDDGLVDCWGQNYLGQAEPHAGVRLAMVTSGGLFSCGLTVSTRRHICWGLDITVLPVALEAPPNDTSFLTISAGNDHVCGIEAINGSTICWGNNTSNQAMPPNGIPFLALSCGYAFSCGIEVATKEAICWGDNSLGQLEAPSGVRFSVISAGDFYACGVDEASKVQCWGLSVSTSSGNQVINTLVPGYLNVTQGVCTTKACNNGEQALPFNYNTSRQCYREDERLCLPRSNTSLMSSGSVSPSPFDIFMLPPQSPVAPPATKTVVVITISSVTFFATFLCVLALVYVHMRRRSKDQDQNSWCSKACTIIRFTSQELQMASANYNTSMIVGHGAFCSVYRGVLESGREVAIKKAHTSEDPSLTFEMELQLLSRLHHKCLVNLVGYCQEEKVLVFEYMASGSLHDCLFTNRTSTLLNWCHRMRIALQAARGLEYLHVYASPRVIHRDVKSANILLDKVWNAHLADFGLSLNGPLTNRSHLSNQFCIGTEGYLDPECPFPYKLTPASDVYSFGVVLLEILSGREPLDSNELDGGRAFNGLVQWAVHLASQGRHLDILDPTVENTSNMAHGPLLLAIKLALECVRLRGKERPSMSKVVMSLQAIFDALDVDINASNVMDPS